MSETTEINRDILDAAVQKLDKAAQVEMKKFIGLLEGFTTELANQGEVLEAQNALITHLKQKLEDAKTHKGYTRVQTTSLLDDVLRKIEDAPNDGDAGYYTLVLSYIANKVRLAKVSLDEL